MIQNEIPIYLGEHQINAFLNDFRIFEKKQGKVDFLLDEILRRANHFFEYHENKRLLEMTPIKLLSFGPNKMQINISNRSIYFSKLILSDFLEVNPSNFIQAKKELVSTLNLI